MAECPVRLPRLQMPKLDRCSHPSGRQIVAIGRKGQTLNTPFCVLVRQKFLAGLEIPNLDHTNCANRSGLEAAAGDPVVLGRDGNRIRLQAFESLKILLILNSLWPRVFTSDNSKKCAHEKPTPLVSNESKHGCLTFPRSQDFMDF